MTSYSIRRCSSVSLLEELQILHSSSLPCKNYVVVFNFRENVLSGFGYFLVESYLLMCGGNLQTFWRDVSNFLAYNRAALLPSYYIMPLKFTSISNVSILKIELVSHITHYLLVSSSLFYFLSALVYFCFTKPGTLHKPSL